MARRLIDVPEPTLLLLGRECFVMLLGSRDEHRGLQHEGTEMPVAGDARRSLVWVDNAVKEMNRMKKQFAVRMPTLRAAAGVLLASCLGAATAQTPPQASPANPVVASLGAVTVGRADVERLLQSLPEAERSALRDNRGALDNWLRQRLASETLLREARAKGWAERPEVKARIDAAVDEITQRIVATSYLESLAQLPAGFPSDAEVSTAYEQGKAGFALPAVYRVAQIYLAAPAGDAAAQAKVREEARKLATQARSGDFASLARSRSDDKRSAERGGEVGALPLAQLLPEVRTVVGKLKVGEVSEAVASDAGFHIVKLLETQPARTATLQEMKPQLQAALRQQRQQQLVQAHMAGLAPAGSVTIDGAALDAALRQTP